MKGLDTRRGTGQEKTSAAFRTFTGLITENTHFVRNARTEFEKIAVLEKKPPTPGSAEELKQSKRAHGETLNNMRTDFAKLNGVEQERYKEMFAQRRALLLTLQPAKDKKPDSDETQSVDKLKDLDYLGEILGFEKSNQ